MSLQVLMYFILVFSFCWKNVTNLMVSLSNNLKFQFFWARDLKILWLLLHKREENICIFMLKMNQINSNNVLPAKYRNFLRIPKSGKSILFIEVHLKTHSNKSFLILGFTVPVYCSQYWSKCFCWTCNYSTKKKNQLFKNEIEAIYNGKYKNYLLQDWNNWIKWNLW